MKLVICLAPFPVEVPVDSFEKSSFLPYLQPDCTTDI